MMPNQDILDRLMSMDSRADYTGHELTNEEKELFLNYYQLLPQAIKTVLSKKVLAIYFIKNFIGGGMTDIAFDSTGNAVNILYFNPEIFNHTLSSWITLRENSAFTGNEEISIKAMCSDDYTGLLHTLLHEGAHIYDFHNRVTPFIYPAVRTNNRQSTEFTRTVWKSYAVPLTQDKIHRDTKYPGWGFSGKEDIETAIDWYRALSNSPFCTLYASLNWAEDFAESFTWRYLYERFNISLQVDISKQNIMVYRYILDPDSIRYKAFNEILKDR